MFRFALFARKRGSPKAASWENIEEATGNLIVSEGVAGQVIPGSTIFAFADGEVELDAFSLVAGECEYIGREGIEFYPQELQLFQFSEMGPRIGTVWLRNIQVTGSKYKLPRKRILLETTYLYPLVKSPMINLFEHNYDGLIVAFPYEARIPQKPITADELRKKSPRLLDYYNDHSEIIEKQTKFSDKIRGPNPGKFTL